MIKTKFLIMTFLSLTTSFANANEFQSCLLKLKTDAIKLGISNETFSTYTENLTPDMTILPKLDAQPEFKTPIWDYISNLVDDRRVDEGKELLIKHKDTLQSIYEKYGVEPSVVVAVWGVESNYGKNFGKFPLVQSLGTLSCYGRRQNYFKTEFFSTLRILQNKDIDVIDMNGSWAGAFGHTQFMPSTFEKMAVDFNGDGRKDLINNISDALASTANFLKKSNWDNYISWGYEVKLPPNFNNENEGRKIKHESSYWAKRNITLIDGKPLPANIPETGLLTISGITGPVFLVTKNFDSIYRYNAAESYSLAIAHLSDKLKGGTNFITPWPTDDGPLSKSEKIELQKILVSNGYSLGEITGEIGPKTRAAIKGEQFKLNIEQSGRAGQKLYILLKNKT